MHKSFPASFTYEIRKDKMKVEDITDAINILVDDLYAYLTAEPFTNSIEYDKWEEKIGKQFLNNCLNYRQFQFGKAQKIINVTMKHLYCYNINEDYFTYCHVALDSMTYTGRPSNSLDGGFYINEVNHDAVTKSFSNLTYEEYINIQNEIRNYLNTSTHDYIDSVTGIPLTPFKAEFYIWPRYKK